MDTANANCQKLELSVEHAQYLKDLHSIYGHPESREGRAVYSEETNSIASISRCRPQRDVQVGKPATLCR